MQEQQASVWLLKRRRKLKTKTVTYWYLKWQTRELTESGRVRFQTECLGQCTKEHAKRMRDRKSAKLGGRIPVGRTGRVTLGELEALYLERRARSPESDLVAGRRHKRYRKLSPATIRQARATLDKMVRHFGEDRRIGTISETDADRWLDELEAAGLAEQTIRQHLRVAKCVFGWAVTFDLVELNPFRDFTGSTLPAKPGHFVPMAEFEQLSAAAPHVGWRALLGLTRLAGLRKTEALELLWSGVQRDAEGIDHKIGVDLEAGRLRLVASKTGRYRLVPIVKRLETILLEAYDAAPAGQQTVVAGDVGGSNIYHRLYQIFEASGVPRFRDPFNALRASRENAWKEAGVAEPTYLAWMGHGQVVSRAHYVEPTPAEFAGAIKAE